MSLSRVLKTFLQPKGVFNLHAGRSSLAYRVQPSFSSNNDAPDGFDKFRRKSKKVSTTATTQETKQSTEQKVERHEQQSEQDISQEQPSFSSHKKEEQPKVEKVREEQAQTIIPKESQQESQKEALKQEQTSDQKQKPTESQKPKEDNASTASGWSNKQSTSSVGSEDKKKVAASTNTKQSEKQQEKTEKDKSAEEEAPEEEQETENKKQKEDSSNEEGFQKRIEEFLKQGDNKRNVIGGIALALLTPIIYYQYEARQYISYTEFVKEYLQPDNVKSIEIQRLPIGTNVKSYASITSKDGQTKKIVLGNVDHFLEHVEAYQLERGRDSESLIPITFNYLLDVNKLIDSSFSWLSTIATITIGYVFFKQMKQGLGGMKGGGGGGAGGGQDIFGMGKSNVKVFGIDSKVTTRFRDVAGQDEAKQEIMEFVDFLKKPTKYKAIGAKLPRGALLTGPPGTGKTLLAKACAGEAGVPFFFISGSDFVEMFVGVGASRVRDLFKQAKAKSPSIIFIDEIDAVGRKRENKMGGNDERDNTLNQLLVEMDGFGTDSNVIVLAATNRKELLDPALTRPGRFDRSIDVTNPDIDGRKQIFMVHLKPLKLNPAKTMDEYARRLATLTPGFSGADIMNLCNEAAILAARKNKKEIESIDFELASERVIAGLEKKRIVSEDERRIVAVHESGHAVASWFLAGGHPLLKLTIIPRTKGSLGFAQYLPNESSLESKGELLDRLCTILGGRVAEEEFFGSITTGAYDDLKRAYELAHALVTKYGMSDRLGYVGYIENDYSKTYSDTTNTHIDEEIKRLIEEATVKTRELIKTHRNYIEGLSNALLEKETLDLRQITGILGHRPFPAKSNFKAYIDLQNEDDAELAAAAAAAANTNSSSSDSTSGGNPQGDTQQTVGEPKAEEKSV